MDELTLEAIVGRLSKSGRRVVFVAALAGAGKSHFCEAAARQTGGVAVQIDWYLKYPTVERRERMRRAVESHDSAMIEAEENPRNWYDWDAFRADLNTLKLTGEVSLKSGWNQKTGEKDLDIRLEAKENAIIWCDGIYLLDAEIAEAADLVVLLQASADIVRQRAEVRDNHRNTAKQLEYKNYLVETYDEPYIAQNGKRADIVIDNSDFDSPRLMRNS